MTLLVKMLMTKCSIEPDYGLALLGKKIDSFIHIPGKGVGHVRLHVPKLGQSSLDSITLQRLTLMTMSFCIIVSTTIMETTSTEPLEPESQEDMQSDSLVVAVAVLGVFSGVLLVALVVVIITCIILVKRSTSLRDSSNKQEYVIIT